VGTSAFAMVTITNERNLSLSVSDIRSTGKSFVVFPPTSFDMGPDGPPRSVSIGFIPTAAGVFSETVSIQSRSENGAEEDLVIVEVVATGVEPAPNQAPDIEVRPTLEFGTVTEEEHVDRELTVKNIGDAPLTVARAFTSAPAFEVISSIGFEVPFTLAPDEARNVRSGERLFWTDS